MNHHKNQRLTHQNRKQIWKQWQSGRWTKAALAREWNVSWPTIQKVIDRARKKEFFPRNSTNKRFRLVAYGIKRLAKVEQKLEWKLKRKAKRYNKQYPGEMVHFDTKRLPLLSGEGKTMGREYLFVAIDDYSRELYATIMPDKTQHSSRLFLEQVIEECPYTIEYTYSDNGKEYKGASEHAFVALCTQQGIGQKFTRVRRPQTNGKAERVIRTLMEMWHEQTHFTSRVHRKTELIRFVNWYNNCKPHKSLKNMTPMEQLISYFFPEKL